MGKLDARVLALALLAAALVTSQAFKPVYAVPPPNFSQCPKIGADFGCKLLIVLNSTGVFVLDNTTAGPFDGIEDTLIGVQNNLAVGVPSLVLNGTFIFGFDGDGICSGLYGAWVGSAGCPFGPTGYEGPNATFVVTNVNGGLVNFTSTTQPGGLPAGGHTFFSLEEPLNATTLIVKPPPGFVIPEVPIGTILAVLLPLAALVLYTKRHSLPLR